MSLQRNGMTPNGHAHPEWRDDGSWHSHGFDGRAPHQHRSDPFADVTQPDESDADEVCWNCDDDLAACSLVCSECGAKQ